MLDSRAVRWDRQGRLTVLPPLPGTTASRAIGIDDSGVEYGISWTQNYSATYAVRWDRAGHVHPLPGLGGTDTNLQAASTTGDAAGFSVDASGAMHAVRWDSRGRITDLGKAYPGVSTLAQFVNDSGSALGLAYQPHGTDSRTVIRWDRAGHPTELADLPGTSFSDPIAIDNRDMAIGYVFVPGGNWHAVRWDRGGGVTDLPAPVAGSSFPYALDDAGIVAGKAVFTGSVDHAAIWDATGRIQDLGALTAGEPSAATAINDSGVVVGSAFTAAGMSHAVLWRIRYRS